MTSVIRLIFCGWVFPYISCIPYSLFGWGLLRFEVPEMFGERRNDTLMWIETFDWATEKKLLLSILPGQIITSGRSKDSRSKWFNRRTKTIRTWTPSPQSKETRWMSEGHRWSRSSRHGTAGSSHWFRNKTVCSSRTTLSGRHHRCRFAAWCLRPYNHWWRRKASTQKKCGQSLVFPSSLMRKAFETIDLLRVYFDKTIPLNALSLPIDSQSIIQHEELEENSPKSRYNAAATLRKKYSSWIQTIHLIFTVFLLRHMGIAEIQFTTPDELSVFSWWFVLFTFSPWTMPFIYSEMVIFQLSGRVYNTLNLVSELIPVKLTRGAVHRNLTVRIASGKL